MAGSAQREQNSLTITRQPDGRHAITDALGNVLGIHNSPVSAARQASLYFGHPTAEPMEPNSGAPAQHIAQQQQAANQAMAQNAAQQQMRTAMAQRQEQGMLQNAQGQQMSATPVAGPNPAGAPSATAQLAQAAALAQAHANQAAALHQAAAAATPQTFQTSNGGQTATGVSPQQAANVALVQQRSGPNGPPASAMAQQAAYNAFHPGK